MLLDKLHKKGLINPPSFVLSNACYVTISGSHAYGVADTNVKTTAPDMDVYGFCIPPKDYIFPMHRGEIPGFGTPGPTFQQWQQHHIKDEDAHGGRGQEWDLQVFNIVKFFELCRGNNPNMIDSLFTPENCVLHCTRIGQMVRDRRRLFLAKHAWNTFRGYAASQLHKMTSKETLGVAQEFRSYEDSLNIPHDTTFAEVEDEISRRKKEMASTSKLVHLTDQQLHGYHREFQGHVERSSRFEFTKIKNFDTKFGYHLVRLFDEVEQILLTHDIDLQRSREVLKAIRRGDWTIQQIKDYVDAKTPALEAAYVSCTLPDKPDEKALKELLVQCLEEHYGSLGAVFQQPDWSVDALKKIDQLIEDVRTRLYQ